LRWSKKAKNAHTAMGLAGALEDPVLARITGERRRT